MGTVKKIGDDYYIEFYARGLLYQQKAADQASAEKLLQEVEEKIRKGEMAVMVRDIEVDVFVQTFIEHVREIAPLKTVKRFENAAHHFLRYCQNAISTAGKISQVTPAVIEGYRLSLIKESQKKFCKIKKRLIDFTLLLVTEMMDYGIKLGYINDNPVVHVKYFIGETDHSEFNVRIPKACDFPLIQWIVWTGLTPGEMAGLCWDDVNFSKKQLILGSGGSAEGRPLQRHLPLRAEAVDYLQKLYQSRKQGEFVFTDEKDSGYEVGELQRIINQQLRDYWPDKKMNYLRLRRVFVAQAFPQKSSLSRLSQLLGFRDVARAMYYQSGG